MCGIGQMRRQPYAGSVACPDLDVNTPAEHQLWQIYKYIIKSHKYQLKNTDKYIDYAFVVKILM